MFAVVKTGGKQYRVAKDDVIRVEKLDAKAGDTVILDQVLMISGDDGAQAGTPMLDGAAVAVEVVEQMRDKKVIIYKKKRRQNYRRKKGHRQHLTVLKVTDIALDGTALKASAPVAVEAPADEAVADEAPKKAKAKKASAKKAAATKAEPAAEAASEAPVEGKDAE